MGILACALVFTGVSAKADSRDKVLGALVAVEHTFALDASRCAWMNPTNQSRENLVCEIKVRDARDTDLFITDRGTLHYKEIGSQTFTTADGRPVMMMLDVTPSGWRAIAMPLGGAGGPSLRPRDAQEGLESLVQQFLPKRSLSMILQTLQAP